MKLYFRLRNTRGTKTMKKHIGTKVYSMLLIILLVVMGYGAITILGIRQMKDSIANLSDFYMQLQVQNEIVTRNSGEARINGNLIVLTPDEAKATAAAKQIITYATTIGDTFKEMEILCVRKCKDEELSQALKDYEKQMSNFEENVMSLASQYLAGDLAGASKTNEKTESLATALQ